MSFSANNVIHKIMLEYLQPYELAVLHNTHTHQTYCNAAVFGCIEYLQVYRKNCRDIDYAVSLAAEHDQLDTIAALIKLGATAKNALHGAIIGGHLTAFRYVVELKTNIPDHWINIAVEGHHIDILTYIFEHKLYNSRIMNSMFRTAIETKNIATINHLATLIAKHARKLNGFITMAQSSGLSDAVKILMNIKK